MKTELTEKQTERLYKKMKNVIVNNFTSLTKVFPKEILDEHAEFIIEVVMGEKTCLKKWKKEEYFYSAELSYYQGFIDNYVDNKYNVLHGLNHIIKNETHRDVREKMIKIDKDYGELEYISQIDFCYSKTLEYVAFKVLAREKEKAKYLCDKEKLKEIESIKAYLVADSEILTQTFKCSSEELARELQRELKEDYAETLAITDNKFLDDENFETVSMGLAKEYI